MPPAPQPRFRMRDDRGSESIQAAIVTPLLIVFVCMAIAAGRLVTSGSTIDAAAQDAARAASLARTYPAAQTAAQTAAQSAATESLTEQGVRCASTHVKIDAAGLTVPVGHVGYVTATVTCTVPLSDLLLPGAPGSHTLKSSFTSVVDAYRSRKS